MQDSPPELTSVLSSGHDRNPTQGCRCGHYGDPRKECQCSKRSIERYRARISGPLLDRIDLHVEVPAVPVEDLMGRHGSDPSSAVAARVLEARRRQAERFGRGDPSGTAVDGRTGRAGEPGHEIRRSEVGSRLGAAALTNARVDLARLRACADPDARGRALLARAMENMSLSARAHGRLLRVARTIADLEGSEAVRSCHVAEAIQHRCLDRPVEVVAPS